MAKKTNGSENAEAVAVTVAVAGAELPPEFIDLIAQVCHEVNATYCRSLGDDSQPSWGDAPDWHRESMLAGVRFRIENPDAPDSASHESWMAVKLLDGWVFGEVKDTEKKTHPCLVPFDQLPPEQQAKDAFFGTVVRALASPLGHLKSGIDLVGGEILELRDQLLQADAKLPEIIKERDALQAKFDKLDAAPRARSGKAKARKCGPLEATGFAPHELLAEIGAADAVEVVFSDGKVEVGIPPILPSGRAWAVTPVGLQLRVPELAVEGPMTGPVKLAGYGLFLNGEQVAWGPRADVLDIVPGRKMDMRHDVVFPAG